MEKVVELTEENEAKEETLEETAKKTAKTVKEVFDSFSDEVPEIPEEESQPTEEEVKKAKGFLNSFSEFIQSNRFRDEVNKAAREYQVPPKRVAENFFEKALGTIGDILGIGINVAGNAAHTLITLLSTLCHGAVNIIVKVANGIASMITMNKTCCVA